MRIGSPAFSQPSYRLAFVGLSAALLALMLAVAPRFGATWDEPQQRGKALRLLAYLSGRTATLNEPIDGAHLYGAPFDIVAAALEPVVPADPYVIRHEVIAVVGWTCILLTGLLADRIFGPPHGLLAMALLAASPPFFAHAMNNPKDLPFAAVSTAVLLIFWTMGSRPPWASPRALVLLALVIGLGLNVRAGALLFIGYLAAVCGYWLMRGPLTLRDLLKAAASVASVLAIAVAIGWVGWPWAYQHPIRAPFMAMSELGHFAWPGSVLYDGASYAASSLPGDYVPRWLWLTLSPVVLAGLALSSLALARAETRDAAVLLWGAALFPIFYVIGTHASLYDGVRHLLFIFPLLFIISASGWVAVWRSAGRWRPGVALIATLGLLEPVAFQVRNHPNQTTYIQPLAGGPAYAFARYRSGLLGQLPARGACDG